jgi:t-SNARE complex subunit (syntaxin)
MAIPQAQDFVWTWNFILTAGLTIVVLPTLGKVIIVSIKRHLTEQDVERAKKDLEIKRLLLEREAEKEKHIKERWDSFTKTQCDIKTNLDSIAKAMVGKLDKGEHEDTCEKHLDIIWDRLDHHSHDEKGNVSIPAGVRR